LVSRDVERFSRREVLLNLQESLPKNWVIKGKGLLGRIIRLGKGTRWARKERPGFLLILKRQGSKLLFFQGFWLRRVFDWLGKVGQDIL